MDNSFFGKNNKDFVDAIYNLANPTSKSVVNMKEVTDYISIATASNICVDWGSQDPFFCAIMTSSQRTDYYK